MAVGVSLTVALLAWGAGALTRNGALAAALVGAAVLWAAGWNGGGVLAAFFFPSTLVGRLALARGATTDTAAERRNAGQVLANGLPGAAGALLERWIPGLGLWILTAALAAAAADTFATSLGGFSRRDPRNILTGRAVPRGTSGGVSVLGCAGAAAGAAIVAAAGGLAGGGIRLLVVGSAIGFVGMLLDSLLGAARQGQYQCPACGAGTERRHHCGAQTRLIEGWRWLDNDAVNALSTTLAAALGALAWALFA